MGILGNENTIPHIVDGLRRLEYRGYDSAGVATLKNGHIERRRAKGKLSELEIALDTQPLSGTIGIGHTRWATHGMPNTANAHPHTTDKVAIVHNGIIENFQQLKIDLEAKGHSFSSETDTEIIAVLITEYLKQGLAPQQIMDKLVKELEGAYAIAVMIAGYDDHLYCARKGSPLVIGYGDGEMYIGSDAIALAPLTRKLCYLEEGDWAILTRDGAEIFDQSGNKVERPIRISEISASATDKGNYQHYMLKEIYEQAEVLGHTMHNLVDPETKTVKLPKLPFDFNDVTKLTLVACGTSYHSALTAKYWAENFTGIPVEVDIASEYRYRKPYMPEGGIAIFVSQSGETIDTLEALRFAKQNGQKIVTIVNRPESTMAREADVVLQTLVGPEIGVASTKAFTGQLIVLACFMLAASKARGLITEEQEIDYIAKLSMIPNEMHKILQKADEIREIARTMVDVKDVLYLGRGLSFPAALEGALKLKEISYIHAEGYAAGEMKHGPIALIEKGTPIVVIAPSDHLFEKTASNLEEVAARGAHVIFIGDQKGADELRVPATKFVMPETDEFLQPILYAVPTQLLAYFVAVFKGTDVDQPRNLAKSVTVE
jgi:glutamine---fructose-6-phosphate transaminase (isomerizing)